LRWHRRRAIWIWPRACCDVGCGNEGLTATGSKEGPNAVAPITAFPGNGQQRAELAEIAALKKEVAKLKAERDILKKAAAFFARE